MAYAAYRAAFRRAALRWHPDKFAKHRARFRLGVAKAAVGGDGGGPATESEDQAWQRVLGRVQGIAQGLNQEWERIAGDLRRDDNPA